MSKYYIEGVWYVHINYINEASNNAFLDKKYYLHNKIEKLEKI